MSDKYQKTCAAELDSLHKFRELIDVVCKEHPHIGEQFCYDMKLAVEEACENIITHGYADMNPGTIILMIEVDAQQAVLEITDFGHAFEPHDAPAPDIEAGLDDQPMSGFGLFFIYQTMDKIDYETTSDCNRLILIKRLKSHKTE